MNDNFKKQKNAFLLRTLIKSGIVGLSCGVFVACTVLLILKLCAVDILWVYYILIGFGVSATVGGAVFLFIKPDDMEIARRLDKDYCLNEKVQTMVAFSGQEGDIVQLQRSDAQEKLATLPKKRIDVRKIWQYVAVPVLAFAMLFTAVLIPAATKPPVKSEATEITNWQKSALKELISDVQKSNLENGLKTDTLTELDGLLSRMDDVFTPASLKELVLNTVKSIDKLFWDVNTYPEIVTQLRKFNDFDDVAGAIEESVTFYKIGGSVVSRYEQVLTYEAVLEDKIGEKVAPRMAAFGKVFTAENTAETIADINESLGAALASSGVQESDSLYAAFSAYSEKLVSISYNIGNGYNTAAILEKLASALSELGADMTEILCLQTYNKLMDEFVRERLAEIFGISASELPAIEGAPQGGGGNSSSDPSVTPGGDDDKPDDNGNQGGFGKGDIKYGSDDIIYYRDEDSYVEYGTVLNEYWQKMFEKLENGTIPDDMEEFVSKYFDILYSGQQAEEEKN